jgi:hypothetical protein
MNGEKNIHLRQRMYCKEPLNSYGIESVLLPGDTEEGCQAVSHGRHRQRFRGTGTQILDDLGALLHQDNYLRAVQVGTGSEIKYSTVVTNQYDGDTPRRKGVKLLASVFNKGLTCVDTG